MLRVIGNEPPDRAMGKRSGYQRQASGLIEHQEHDRSTECIEGHEALSDLGFLPRLFDRKSFLRTLELHALHKNSFVECPTTPRIPGEGNRLRTCKLILVGPCF